MDSDDSAPPGASLLFVIPCCLIGLLFAKDALSNGLNSRRIQESWLVVPAKVVSRMVKEAYPAKSGERPTWRPSVVYEYQWAEHRYQCDHVDVRWAEGTSDAAGPEEVITSYVPGQVVTAHVNPQNPLEAVLDATPMVSWVELFVGIGLGSLALLFGFGVYRTTGSLRCRSPGPILLGFLWIVFSAIGLASSVIAGRAPTGVWITTALHAVVGVSLAAWQIRGVVRRPKTVR
jgi:hypothetical protein